MSLESLQQRLAALQESTSQLRDLITRLADLPFRPGALPAAVDEEGSPSSELSGEIGALMRGGLEEQQNLLEEAKFVRLEGPEKRRLQDGIAELGLDMSRCRSALRRARLCAKQNLVRAQRTERELIIQSFAYPAVEPPEISQSPSTSTNTANPDPTSETHTHTNTNTNTNTNRHISNFKERQRARGASLSEKDRHTVNASSSLTTALRRTHALMTAELTRSEFAHQMLAESSDALAALDASYTSLDGMLSSSRALLGTLLRAQKSDTWYLQTARWMLLGTLAWLVFRRLLYGPMWWLVYLPLRVAFGVTWGAGRAALEVGGGLGGLRSGKGGGGLREGAGRGSGRMAVDVDVEGLPGEDLPTVRMGDGDELEDEETVVLVMDGEPNVIRGEDGAAREGVDGAAEAVGGSRSRDEL